MNNIAFFGTTDKYNHKNNNDNEDANVSGDIITEDGRRKVLDRLREMSKQKPLIAKEIQTAKENGGIEENEEFTMALDKLSRLEYDMSILQNVAQNYHIISIPSAGEYNEVKIGMSVTILNLDTDREVTYQILGEYESDPKNGIISHKSPLGKELIGCKVGDYVDLERGNDFIEYEVLRIFSK